MIIAVTGTPGTGKTTVSTKLSELLNYKFLDVNDFISKHKEVVTGFDKERDSKIIDVKKLSVLVKKYIKENKISNLIIDSHLSHYFSPKIIELVIIVTCDLKKLKLRLKKRGYSEIKIRENLDCEIFEVCKTEALDFSHKIYVIDTTKKLSYSKIKKDILSLNSMSFRKI